MRSIRHSQLLSVAALTALLTVFGSSVCRPLPTIARADDKPAPLFNDLGSRHWTVSTTSEAAQRYFDQGMILTYGFNHAEAGRSFLEVTKSRNAL